MVFLCIFFEFWFQGQKTMKWINVHNFPFYRRRKIRLCVLFSVFFFYFISRSFYHKNIGFYVIFVHLLKSFIVWPKCRGNASWKRSTKKKNSWKIFRYKWMHQDIEKIYLLLYCCHHDKNDEFFCTPFFFFFFFILFVSLIQLKTNAFSFLLESVNRRTWYR